MTRGALELRPTRQAEGIDDAGDDALGRRLRVIAVRRHRWVQLGYNLQAAMRCGAGDRQALEQTSAAPCFYSVLNPTVASDQVGLCLRARIGAV